MPATGLTVYPAPPTVIPSPIGWNSYQDGDTVDFNGTATILGMAPSSNVYTLTQNLSVKNLTIRSGVRVKSNGYVIFAKLFVIESGGFLSFNGNDASTVTGGAAFLAANTGHLGCACGAGANGVTLSTVTATNGSAGSGSGGNNVGGIGGTGGAGGTATGGAGNATAILAASQFRYWRSLSCALSYWRIPPTANTVATVLVNGGGGGGAGGAQRTGGVGNLTSGGGGGAAGIIGLRVGTLGNYGTIECLGGAGGNAVLGTATGSAGGGGGGSGGAIHAVCDKLVSVGTFKVSGGAGGTAVGSGFAGLPGIPGTIDLFVAGEAY